MRSRDQTHSWVRVLLAALVLAANVGAPFRSANTGRSLLGFEPPHAARPRVGAIATAVPASRAVVVVMHISSQRQIQPVEAFDSTSSVNNSEGFFQL